MEMDIRQIMGITGRDTNDSTRKDMAWKNIEKTLTEEKISKTLASRWKFDIGLTNKPPQLDLIDFSVADIFGIAPTHVRKVYVAREFNIKLALLQDMWETRWWRGFDVSTGIYSEIEPMGYTCGYWQFYPPYSTTDWGLWTMWRELVKRGLEVFILEGVASVVGINKPGVMSVRCEGDAILVDGDVTGHGTGKNIAYTLASCVVKARERGLL